MTSVAIKCKWLQVVSVHYRLHSLTKGGRKLVAYSIVTVT